MFSRYAALSSAPLFAVAVLSFGLLAATGTRAAEPAEASGRDYFPPPESRGGWRFLHDPQAIRTLAGMDPEKLESLRDWLINSDQRDFAATVIRNGYVVLEVERGNSARTDARRVASVSKAVCATVLAIASEQSQQGRTPKKMTFDDPAFSFLPWAAPLSDPRKAQITVAQLLNHTSGITPEASGARNEGPWNHVLGHDGDPRTAQLAFDPGTACGYSTFAFYHAALVCEEVTGQPYDAFAVASLFRPLGIEHWWFQHFDGGQPRYGRHPSHSMGMPARDLARIAYCMMRGGRWNSQQVIPAWYVRQTGRPTHDVKTPELRFKHAAEIYSHGWELPARLEDGQGEGIPDDARYKPGSGGQLMAFVPSLDLVVTRQTGGSGSWEYAEYLRRACAAVLPPSDQAVPFSKWGRIELSFTGIRSRADGDPNPFAVALDVTFTGPGGQRLKVPGFYDGDGEGGPNGSVWKVRFAADQQGRWQYETHSSIDPLDGQQGVFEVAAVPDDAEGFWKWGRLEYTGTAENQIRYLKFRDGPYWMKAGCDDPENFLGRSPHFDTPAERRAAVDYLAAQGINSLYIMTHNIRGDDNDVWPWLGSAREVQSRATPDARFDIAKLDQWDRLFQHMQTRGVVPYLVLEDDSAWTGYDHPRYCREMIARFGYLPALMLNLGEEYNENYSLDEGLRRAAQLAAIDPYDHPRGIHNVNDPKPPYIHASQVDFTAIQTGHPERPGDLQDALRHNQIAIDWIERCRTAGQRVLVVNFDEGRPELDRRAWWSAYLGGGVWEAHVPPPFDRSHTTWDATWRQLGGTRAFLQSMPFWEMQPRNDLVRDGQAFCLAKPGEVYALYLPAGGTIAVRLADGARYQVSWWDPASSQEGRFQPSAEVAGGVRRFTAPGDGDWALRIRRSP